MNSTEVAIGKLDSIEPRCDTDDKHCQTFRVAEWHRHPNYKNCHFEKSCLQFDFLLIRIQKKNDKGIQFSSRVHSIPLAHRELRPTKNSVEGEWEYNE